MLFKDHYTHSTSKEEIFAVFRKPDTDLTPSRQHARIGKRADMEAKHCHLS